MSIEKHPRTYFHQYPDRLFHERHHCFDTHEIPNGGHKNHFPDTVVFNFFPSIMLSAV